MSEQTHNWSDIVSGYFLDVIFVTAGYSDTWCVGQAGHPGTVLECPSNYGTQNTQTHGVWGKLDIQGQSWSVQVTMVHRILRHMVCGASWTSRDSPGVSE
jgi:hypothetical protein